MVKNANSRLVFLLVAFSLGYRLCAFKFGFNWLHFVL